MKQMKRRLLVLITILGLLCYPLSGYAQADELDFEDLFNEAVILSIGSPNAIYDTEDRIIDENNYNIVPYVKSQRTMVPLRFISESLGARVAWNQATSTATITLAGKEIKITLGSKTILVNGKKTALDAPAEYQQGRTFVPIRLISETLGKKVFYSRGIIVISEKAILHPVQDAEIVDYLKFILEPYNKSPYTGKNLTNQQIAGFEQSVVVLEALDRSGESTGFGSAFAVGYGLYLTNYHVINEASSYVIYTGKDQVYEAAGIVAVDKMNDLALVKAKIRTNVPPLHIGSTQNLAKGQAVVAIGNPEGLQNTVSTGVISGLRVIDGQSLIQFTAPIASGSSGGALFNKKGEVIGVTSSSIDEGNLNFAVPIDYAKSWISKYNSAAFSKITVLNQDQFREPSNGSGTVTPEETPKPPAVTPPTENVSVLNEVIQEAVTDPSRPVVYAIDDTESTIVSYDLAKKKVTKISTSFSKAPRKLVYASGELYVIFSDGEYSPYRFDEEQGGTVRVLDPSTLQVIDEWDVDIDPYDIAADESGHVYLTSGSGQWTYMKSYDRTTKRELSSSRVYHQTKIMMHPSENRIYSITTPLSPRDMDVFRLTDGKITTTYDSPYHGDYKLSTVFGITPDGKFIVNGAGSIFTATNNKTSDMNYAGTMDKFDIFVANKNHTEKFYTATKNVINQVDTNTLSTTKTYKTQGTIVKLLMTDTQLIAITKVTVTGSALTRNAIELIAEL
ncbi:stalk domain-containing protein [Paenibacillus sp. An7]|uniref:stalk domain-containing protein n=1 Tax=Paenibacillus sp. An7 TaxID=2689577 RepID=UPI00135B693B|nr:stalk domain-containing protein [Paenibacillus sp. An7]